MKLSKEQIEKLYAFVRKKGLMYLDLQDEMVDHLANSIEDQINENPRLTFDKALQIEYKKFGVFGFDGVYVKRYNALKKKGLKIYLKHLLSFFKLPKILMSISIFLMLNYLSDKISNQSYIYYGTNLIWLFYMGYLIRWKFKGLKDVSGKYLVTNQYNSVMILTVIIYFIIDFPFIVESENIYSQFPNWLPLAMTFLLIQTLITDELLTKLDSYIKECGLIKMKFNR